MIKAVIIGFAHMHVNEVALYLAQQPDFELAAVADADAGVEKVAAYRYTSQWNLQNVKEKYCSNVYEDYEKMLEEEKPDMAFILTENSLKAAVVEACAKRGVNVCIEKPMAASYAEAKKIQKLVQQYGIEAVVNWPVAWRPYLHKLKAALDAKVVGETIKLRYINGHTGPLGKGARHRGVTENAEEISDEIRGRTWWHQEKFGGGVFLDISCYGCLFAKWLLGDGEESVLSYGANLNTPYGDTADNFAAIIKYTDKMAVIEGTWTTPRAVIPSGPMVICTDGVILCTGGAEDAPDVAAYDIYGNEMELPEYEDKQSLQNMPWHYAACKNNGEEILDILTLDRNVEIMAMIEAMVKASASGKEEKIDE